MFNKKGLGGSLPNQTREYNGGISDAFRENATGILAAKGLGGLLQKPPSPFSLEKGLGGFLPNPTRPFLTGIPVAYKASATEIFIRNGIGGFGRNTHLGLSYGTFHSIGGRNLL